MAASWMTDDMDKARDKAEDESMKWATWNKVFSLSRQCMLTLHEGRAMRCVHIGFLFALGNISFYRERSVL